MQIKRFYRRLSRLLPRGLKQDSINTLFVWTFSERQCNTKSLQLILSSPSPVCAHCITDTIIRGHSVRSALRYIGISTSASRLVDTRTSTPCGIAVSSWRRVRTVCFKCPRFHTRTQAYRSQH